MKSIILTLTVALFIGTQNTQAIRLTNEVTFVDDVVRLLDESDKREAEQLSQQHCNPCSNSAGGQNPHYPGAKPDGDKKANYFNNPEADKKTLAQADCNPCPDSAAGKNPHYTVAVA